MVELVIKLPERVKAVIDRDGTNEFVTATLWLAVKNGILLPKGHGNIVDIETLIDMFWDGNSMEITKYDLSVIEPIVEADKAEK